MSTPKVWFITGASSGFGRAVTEIVLKNGDIAVATLRKPTVLSDLSTAYPASRLLVLPLEVRDTEAIKSSFSKAVEKFGRVDVVFNNAGYPLLGEGEGVPEERAREQVDVNFWAAANVTREALRVFRDVNSPPGGRLLQNITMGVYAAVPLMSYYAASKAGFQAFSTTIAAELDPKWNVKITCIAPGSFHTNIKGGIQMTPQHPAYVTAETPTIGFRQYLAADPELPGNPVKAGEAIYKLGGLSAPPRYFPLGKDAIAAARAYIAAIKEDLDGFEAWSDEVGC